MKLVVPDYVTRFQCIAGACRHNCCAAGWDIEVDEESFRRYLSVAGGIGERLRAGIYLPDGGGERCMRLDNKGHCVFWNGDGLCDIAAVLGESALCEVCREFPRSFAEYNDRTEMNISIACEEACRLILENPEKTVPVTVRDDGAGPMPTEREARFYALREQILALLQDRALPFDLRVRRIQAFCGIRPDRRPPAYWGEVYRALCIQDVALTEYLRRFASRERFVTDDGADTVWEQLTFYFLFEYLNGAEGDESLRRRVAFALHAVSVIRTMAAGAGLGEIEEICRRYSREIEYAEKNANALMRRMEL